MIEGGKPESGKNISFQLFRELFSGGLANAISSCCLNWSDVTKVRLQTQAQLGHNEVVLYRNFRHCISRIISEEGFFSKSGGLMLPGIIPSIMREFGYSSFRFGCYPYAKQMWGCDTDGDSGLVRKLGAGLTTGGFGSALANPTDLVKIRFQREAGKLGPDGKYATGLHKGRFPTYTSTFDAFRTIYNKEGLAGLYKGTTATVFRAAFLAAGQLATYDHSKYILSTQNSWIQEGVQLHVSCSVLAACAATLLCQPFDTVKSRFMSDKQSGRSLYNSPVHCFIQTFKYEGVGGLYKGTTASFARICPHFIIALPLWEQLRKFLGLGYL